VVQLLVLVAGPVDPGAVLVEDGVVEDGVVEVRVVVLVGG
jgi:hypothetical protein